MTTEIRARGAGRPARSRADQPDFPILDQEINGHRLVYLDSASTSQKPRVVIEARRRLLPRLQRERPPRHLRAGREGDRRLRGRAGQGRDADRRPGPARDRVRPQRDRGDQPRRLLRGAGKHIARGDVIVLTEMEHHANLVPWQILAQEKDADLEFIPITDDGLLRQDVFDVLLKLKPKLVAFTHVSNTLGTINPVEEMTRKAHEAGALVLIDGAQAVPHVPVDVQAIGCDFYVFSGHKMLAPDRAPASLWGRSASCSRRCRRSWAAAT